MPHLCPKCRSDRVYRSHRHGATERLLALFGLKPRRCRNCRARFVTFGGSVLLRSDLDTLVRKLSLAGMAAVAILIVVALVLWFSHREENLSACALSRAAGAILVRAVG